MANFEKCAAFPQGYDEVSYTVTVPVGSARFFCLWGGGPSGERLQVTYNSTLLDLMEAPDKDLMRGTHLRAFRIAGKAPGVTAIGAAMASGQPYSKPLNVRVTADDSGVRELDQLFQDSRQTLKDAITKLESLHPALGSVAVNIPISISGDDAVTLAKVQKWLFTPPLVKADGTAREDKQSNARDTSVIVGKALNLMRKNLNCKTAAGKDPMIMRSPRNAFGLAYGNPAFGLELGEPAFSEKGPKCRRDVVTHEFFHLVGVGHGEAPGTKRLPYAPAILPPDLALNSADHLSQLISDLTTGSSHACKRSRE